MSDLIPDTGVMLPITNQQRRDAAVQIAEVFDGDRHAVAYLLTELGLAHHHEEGHFSASMEVRPDDGAAVGDWFASISRRNETAEATTAFRIAPRALDDRR